MQQFTFKQTLDPSDRPIEAIDRNIPTSKLKVPFSANTGLGVCTQFHRIEDEHVTCGKRLHALNCSYTILGWSLLCVIGIVRFMPNDHECTLPESVYEK